MKMATYTTIVHSSLAQSGLTVQEFFVADVIAKLSNPYCTMLRDKMADLSGVSRSGLQGVLRRLRDKGFITISPKGLQATQAWNDLAYTEDVQKVNDGTYRKCTSDVQKVHVTRAESARGDVHKVNDTIYIYDINKDINKDIYQTPSVQENPIPAIPGKTAPVRIAEVYGILWLDTFGTRYLINYAQFTKVFSALLKQGLTELQCMALVVMHFRWHGTTGEDDFAQKNLESNGYPIFWIASKVNDYSTYIQNVLGLDWNSPDAMRAFVKENIRDGYAEAVKRGIIKTTNQKEQV